MNEVEKRMGIIWEIWKKRWRNESISTYFFYRADGSHLLVDDYWPGYPLCIWGYVDFLGF